MPPGTRLRTIAFGTVALGLAAQPLRAQNSAEQDVLAVVNRMFDGMRHADSAAVRSAFASGARFAGVDPRSTPAAVRYDTVGGWITAIANSRGRWDEQVYDMVARTDGGVAIVWAPYTFYLDRKVSHCGVNVVDLLQVGTEWKIIQIYDSRRRENCPDPLASSP